MRRLVAIFTLVLLSVEARANEPDADVRSVIGRGLTFLAKDNMAWKESKKCYECHDALGVGWRPGISVAERLSYVGEAFHDSHSIPKNS